MVILNLLLSAIQISRLGTSLPEVAYFFLTLIKNLIYLTIFCTSAMGFGWLFLRLVRFRFQQFIEYFIFGEALGLGVLSLLVFLLGIAQLLYKETGWCLIAAGLLLFIGAIILWHKDYLDAIQTIQVARPNWFSVIMALLVVANIIYALFGNALVPPTSYDELAYHLAIPRIYIQNHGIIYIPYIPYSNWTLDTEMLFTLNLLVAREEVARLVTWTCFLLVGVTLIRFGRKWFSPETGWLAAALYTSTPMVLVISGTALVEIPLSMYTLLAVVTMIEWLQSEEYSYLFLSALFAGFAAGTKFNGPQTAIILGGFMLIILLLKRPSQPRYGFRSFMLYGSIAFLLVVPWYLKSWVQTGNPFWPFLYELFGGRNWDAQATRQLLAYIRITNLPATIKNWLLGFAYVTYDTGKFGPFFIGRSYLFILPITIPALLLHPNHFQRRIIRWIAILSIAFYTAWFLQTHQTRFMMSFLGIIALLAAADIEWLGAVLGKRWNLLVRLGIAAYLFVFSWMANDGKRATLISKWPYLTNRITRDQYLSQYIPGYPVFEYANQKLPKDAYVFMAVWESRGYLLNRKYSWANPISQRAFNLDSYYKPDDLASALESHGYTHVIFTTYNLYNFPYPHNKQVADLMITMCSKHCKLLYQSGPIEIYRLIH